MLEPQLSFDVELSTQEISVRWRLRNRLAEPILICYSLPNAKTKMAETDWAYVEFVRGTTIIKQEMEILPPGLSVMIPDTPLLREVAPGDFVESVIRLQRPLTERSAYGFFGQARDPNEERTDHLQLRVGWAVEADLGEGPRVTRTTDKGCSFISAPYHLIAPVQRVVVSEKRQIDLPIRVYGAP